ncbi:hypothetical protein AB0A67_24215, partial [Streptomyces eurythermus]
MREKVRRHLGKVLTGAALAAAGTAAMVAVTLPGTAGAGESGGAGGGTAKGGLGAAYPLLIVVAVADAVCLLVYLSFR